VDLVVAYDVNTETQAGRRRLRQVAKVCCGYGARVQKSVFECRLNDKQATRLVTTVRALMDLSLDSLRIYRLHSGDTGAWKIVGRDRRARKVPPSIIV